LAYRILTRKSTILHQKYEIPGLDRLFKHEQNLRKLWQETRDPACGTAVNWVTRNIRRMVRKRVLERWETKLPNSEVTHETMLPIAKSLSKRGGPKAPSSIHDLLGPIFCPVDTANIITDCLENQFRVHNLCDCDHRQHVEAQIEALLAAVSEDIPVNFQPSDVSKEIQSLELGKVCGFDGIPNECLQYLQRRLLVHLTHLFNHCLWLGHFPASWREAKIRTLLKPSKDPKFSPNLSAFCSLWANYLRS
jgi:hypothetical protein